jgi:hypothetical protein
MNRNSRRGIHLPNTNGQRVLQPWEFEALGRIWPGAVSLLHFQLDQDPELVKWLRRRVKDGLYVFVRYWHQFGQVPSTVQVSDTIAALARRHEYVSAWMPANEQNIEGWSDWSHINTWNSDLWWRINWYNQNGDLPAPIKLIYPPFAQDAPLSHTEGYDACHASIETYQDWFSWHDYWHPGSSRMIEDDFPQWLREHVMLVAGGLVHECGRLPQYQGTYDGLIDELVDRFGSINHGTTGRSIATAVTPWLLGDASGQFGGYAYVDEEGGIRQICLDWAEWGP